MKEKLKYWFLYAIRGYSLPMSFFAWAIVFNFCLLKGGNILYGVLAFFGILSVHIGVNLYDDYIDTILKVPKQKCKTEYLDKNIFTIKQIFIGFLIHFLFALIIGVFFLYKTGFGLLYILPFAILISLLYPKLNNFALGEFAIFLMFGPLMFEGVHFVMLGNFDFKIFLISIPISILIALVAMVHSFMDFDFDKISGKKTYPLLFKTKEKAIFGIIFCIIFAYILTLFLIIFKILPYFMILSFLSVFYVVKLYKSLKKCVENYADGVFLNNFMLAQKICIFYGIILILSINIEALWFLKIPLI